MNDLDAMLRNADPATQWSEADIEHRVAGAASRIQRSSPRRAPFWKRTRVAIPVLAAAVALMGAAVVLPLQLWVDGREVDIDLEVPVEYVTAGGHRVACTAGFHFGSPSGRGPELEAAVNELRGRDWSGIGEEIYEHAVAHPVAPQDGEVWRVDTAQVREKIAFELAITAVMTSRTSDTLPAGAGIVVTNDCTGRLS